MASTGASISADELQQLHDRGIVHGLAEVMNFPAVSAGDAEMLAKLAAMAGRPVDGHCPGVVGKMLCAYVAAGVGSDHESISPDEAREKLARGMYLLIREATNAKNLDALLPIITPANARRICFCTDDRSAGDLLRVGSVDDMVRRAIAFGIDPIEAIRMATLNPAEWFGLSRVGGIAPGKAANIFIFDDLRRPTARMVLAGGKVVARDGEMVSPITGALEPAPPQLGRCDVDWSAVSLDVPAKSNRMRVIGVRWDQLVTDHRLLAVAQCKGMAVADPARDLCKMAVIERHHHTGRMGVGFIQGFGIRRGAIAGTVAHDHHNLVVIGADDLSMLAAAHAVTATGGGLAAAVGERIIARLALPVGGLMSDRPAREVAKGYDDMVQAAHELGSTLQDPFMAMSFMGLEVIPSLKLTDQGLVDVEKFERVDLFV